MEKAKELLATKKLIAKRIWLAEPCVCKRCQITFGVMCQNSYFFFTEKDLLGKDKGGILCIYCKWVAYDGAII